MFILSQNTLNSQNSNINTLKVEYQYHPHHLTANSPWPIFTANSVFSIIIGAVLWFNGIIYGDIFLILGIISTTIAFILWFKDITTEGTFLGWHTKVVQHGLSIGVALFIVTEAFFFLSIFWAFIWSSLSPTVELGSQWPPVGVTPLSPITVPLLNTILLVSSGATITYAHHALFHKARSSAIWGTFLTILLAVIFTALQWFEYSEAGFSMPDGAYGTCFFFSTGFHGAHIIIGTIFLIVGFFRLSLYHLTTSHHIGFEASIIYWHFVDIIWLLLYALVYWWGS